MRFFRAATALRKQLAGAEGLVGYSLRAKPLSRSYWTLSVWNDQTALEQFMRTPALTYPAQALSGKGCTKLRETHSSFGSNSSRPENSGVMRREWGYTRYVLWTAPSRIANTLHPALTDTADARSGAPTSSR